jgi:hypothetical protein
VTEVRIAMINVVALPRSEWSQEDAHAHICLAYGNTVDGAFVPRYYESLYFRGAEFGQFVAALGGLEAQTLEAVQQIKGLSGTIK